MRNAKFSKIDVTFVVFLVLYVGVFTYLNGRSDRPPEEQACVVRGLEHGKTSFDVKSKIIRIKCV